MRAVSLKTKFLIGSLGLIALLGAGVIIFIHTTLTRKLTMELQKRGLHIARDFADETVDPLLKEDAITLHMHAIDKKKSEEDVEYAFILDSKGKVLAHTFGEAFPTDLKNANIIGPGQAYNIRQLITEKGTVYDVAVPIYMSEMGTVHIGISAESVRKGVSNIVNIAISVTLVILLFGSVTAIIFIATITRPLSELMLSAKAVGDGDLKHRAAVKTRDEIGRLADTFNSMVEDLQKTTISRSRLEELVRERTAELSETNENLQLEISERRQAEEALRDSEERFHSLFNLASDCILLLDPSAKNGSIITDANISACAMHGYAKEELIGRPIGFLDAPEGTRSGPDIIQRLMEGQAATFEINHIRRDGSIFPVEVSARMIHLGGKPYILAIDRDISERKRTEEVIGRLNRRNEMILNSAGEGIYGVGLDARTTFINPAALKMLGWEADEIIGRQQHDIMHHTRHDGTPHPIEDCRIYAAFRNGGVHQVADDLFWRKDGTSFPVEYVSTPIKEDGSVVGAVVVFKDITKRKKMEEEIKRHREHLVELVEERTVELKTAVQLLTQEINFRRGAEETLKESETKFRRLSQEFHILLDAISDTLLLISPDLKVLWANRGAASGLGMEESDIIGQDCYKLFHKRSTPCEDCYALKSFQTGKTEGSQISTPDGRILESRAFPIRDEDGRVTNVILVAVDITEKITLQSEAMRASHLASLGELAAGVAHEINNPVNGIINYAQILANKSEKVSRQYDIANRIIREGDRIAGIVRSLLSFARERREEKGPVHVRKILTDTITLTEAQILKDNIRLKTDIPPALPEIIANPQQIQQVFLNIMGNARYALNQKYRAFHGDKLIEISGRKVVVDGLSYVRITFYDNGTGIPGDILDKVINPFFSTKPSGQGTGLGLSISHGIVRDHGGRLVLYSEEGRFTKVMIDLPAAGDGQKLYN